MRTHNIVTIGLALCLGALSNGCAIFEKPVATIATGSLPRELDKVSLPPYVVEPPDWLIIQVDSEVTGTAFPPLSGQFMVRPDGTIAIGAYGELYVAGLTLDQIKQAIYERLSTRLELMQSPQDIFVDVMSYNSKVYYIITDGGGSGEEVDRLPSTGNETVLDALSHVGGLSPISSKDRVWIARPTPHGQTQILPVDWKCIVKEGSTRTNYQIMPGDRIYVKADPLVTIDTLVAKITAPVERVLGNILLWNVTVRRLDGSVQGNRGTGGGF